MEKTDNSISMNNGTYMPPIGYSVFRMTDEKTMRICSVAGTKCRIPPMKMNRL